MIIAALSALLIFLDSSLEYFWVAINAYMELFNAWIIFDKTSPWRSPAILLYRPSLLVGLQGYILNRHRATVYMFYPVVLPLLVHVKGSTGVCHLWACRYFSSSVQCVWFIWLGEVTWWVVSGCTSASLWGDAFRNCLMLPVAFFCSCRTVFSP